MSQTYVIRVHKERSKKKKKKVTRMTHRNALAEHWMGGGGTKEMSDGRMNVKRQTMHELTPRVGWRE